MEDQFKDLLNQGQLINTVACLEAAALDLRDLLSEEERTQLNPEIQQVVDLANVIAEKLNITEQVRAYRNLQDATLKADKEKNQAYMKAVKAIAKLAPQADFSLSPPSEEEDDGKVYH